MGIFLPVRDEQAKIYKTYDPNEDTEIFLLTVHSPTDDTITMAKLFLLAAAMTSSLLMLGGLPTPVEAAVGEDCYNQCSDAALECREGEDAGHAAVDSSCAEREEKCQADCCAKDCYQEGLNCVLFQGRSSDECTPIMEACEAACYGADDMDNDGGDDGDDDMDNDGGDDVDDDMDNDGGDDVDENMDNDGGDDGDSEEDMDGIWAPHQVVWNSIKVIYNINMLYLYLPNINWHITLMNLSVNLFVKGIVHIS